MCSSTSITWIGCHSTRMPSLILADDERALRLNPPSAATSGGQLSGCSGRCWRVAAEPGRVCRAWHRAYEVKVLVPGISGAEGKEKGKGVVVRRGLEEAQSKSAGRRIPLQAGLYKSGVYARNVLCLTPGGLLCALGGRVRPRLWRD